MISKRIATLCLTVSLLVTLAPTQGQTSTFQLKVLPTFLMISRGGATHQIFSAAVEGSQPVSSPLEVVLTDGNEEWRSPVDLSQGRCTNVRVTAPRAARRRNLEAYLTR